MRLSESGLVKRGPPWIRPKNHSKYVKKRSRAGAPHLALISIYGDRPFDSAFGAGEARRLGVSASVATASGALPRAAGGEVASGSCGVVAADAPFQAVANGIPRHVANDCHVPASAKKVCAVCVLSFYA